MAGVRTGGWRGSITQASQMTRFWKGKATAILVCVFWKKKKKSKKKKKKKTRKGAFPHWMQIVGSVFWGDKCECSDALHAQMSLRVLILGDDSFYLKLCFMNKMVMVTICMCGWGMLGQTGKQAMSLTHEWGLSADTGPPTWPLVTFVPLSVCCGVLPLQFHPISHKVCR